VNAWIFGNAVTSCLGLIHRRAGERMGLTGPENDLLGDIEGALKASEVKVVRVHRIGPLVWNTKLESLKPGVDDDDNALVLVVEGQWTTKRILTAIVVGLIVVSVLVVVGGIFYTLGHNAGLHTGLLTKQLPTL
jgi:hypothetical protein